MFQHQFHIRGWWCVWCGRLLDERDRPWKIVPLEKWGPRPEPQLHELCAEIRRAGEKEGGPGRPLEMGTLN